MAKRYTTKRGSPGHNLCNERGWPMQSDEILALFGLPSSGPIHPDWASRQLIGDTWVYIRPRGWHPTKKRRVFAECNICQEHVCAGHLSQHLQGKHDM